MKVILDFNFMKKSALIIAPLSILTALISGPVSFVIWGIGWICINWIIFVIENF
jgi:hypothetical protein